MATIFSQPFDSAGTGFASQNDIAGGGFGDYSQTYSAFSFDDGATVTDVHWTGVYVPGDVPHVSTSFKVAFFADNAGVPGSQLATETILFANVNQTFLGVFGGVRCYSYSVDLSSSFSAAAGTTYWLLVQSNSLFPPQWNWATAGAGSSYSVFFASSAPNDFDVAFDLTGEIEPPACEPEVETQILEDGPRNTVLEFKGSVCGSNLTSTVVVNAASQYIDPGYRTNGYRVDRIDYDIADGITINLYWGGVPTVFAHLSGRGEFIVGYNFGGFQNSESLSVRDGRILATSTRYTGSDELGFTIVMWLVKQRFESQALPSFLLIETGDFLLLESGGKIQLE